MGGMPRGRNGILSVMGTLALCEGTASIGAATRDRCERLRQRRAIREDGLERVGATGRDESDVESYERQR